jgi:hypothetical protein
MKKYLAVMLAAWGVSSAALLAQTVQRVESIITNGLAEPFAVAVDIATNAYYITDSVNNRIVKYGDTTGVTVLAGKPGYIGSEDNAIGLKATFFSPQGLVMVGSKLIVADSGNHILREVSLDGAVRTIAGKRNQPGHVDATGSDAQFNGPGGLAADANGNIYIADVVNNAIRKMDANYVVTTVVATNLYRPWAVAVGPSNTLFIADSGNNCIKIWQDNSLRVYAGYESRSEYGDNDALFAQDARFKLPRGLLYRPGSDDLLVSDSGNAMIRRVYYNTNVASLSVEMYAQIGLPGVSQPIGLAMDNTESLLVVDMGESSLKRLPSSMVVLPPVNPPALGWIALDTNFFSGLIFASLVPITNITFNNERTIAVESEDGVETFYTIGATRDPREVPTPSRNSLTPPPFHSGAFASIGDPVQLMLPFSIVDPITPDVTIKVISLAAGRRPSEVVVGQIRYQVANPTINGKNMASFSLTNITQGSSMYYTVDGSEPTTNSTLYRGGRLSVFQGKTNDIVFSVKGFKDGYHQSATIVQVFKYGDMETTSIGLTQDFEAGVGSTILVPVQVRLLEGDTMRSIQFRAEVEPIESSTPALSTNSLRAMSINTNDFIPLNAPAVEGEIALGQWWSYVQGRVSGIAVAFIGTNAFFEMDQSGPVALLAVQIPTTATHNQKYTISLLEPSATLDGFDKDILMSTLGAKTITVSTNLSYVVGDVSPTGWYNAGEFGNDDLNNSDVNMAFYTSLGLRTPFVFSDVFDSMDAYPVDTFVTVGGDGQIRFLDWQVTLERSLRLDTNVWKRVLSQNGRKAEQGELIRISPQPDAVAQELSASSWFRHAQLGAIGLDNASPGQRVSIPVYLNVKPGYTVRGLQFRAQVTPEGDAPGLGAQADYSPAAGFPAAAWKMDVAAGDLLQAWSIGDMPALQKSNVIGFIRFTVPPTAVSGQNYTVHFVGVDGAPDLQTQFEFESFPVSVWVDCPAQRAPETISDEWKTRFFGNCRLALAQGARDPDDDGLDNATEYAKGTNPVDLRLHSGQMITGQGETICLRWFGELGKTYIVETASNLATPNWQILAANLPGEGGLMEYLVKTTTGSASFCRVRAQ